MPSIKPFRALIPAHHLESEIVTRPLDHYSSGEARLIASENQNSFLHLIDPALAEPSWRDSRAVLIYRKIGLTINNFLKSKVLIQQDKPALYIYEYTHNGLIQNGIWCLCDAKDYLSGSILKHEVTVERREKQLAEYLMATGLDSNPVLITYPPSVIIDGYIKTYQETTPLIDFIFSDQSRHRIWQVDNASDMLEITDCIAALKVLYIADGHHRAAAMKDIGEFSAVLMNTDEIRIRQYNRLVKGLKGHSPDSLLDALKTSFKVTSCSSPVDPSESHEIGMYVAGSWYILRPENWLFDPGHPVESLDVHILQEHILSPLLGIQSPRTDARITFEGAEVPVEILQSRVDHELFSIAFTLFPLKVSELMAVADAGLMMPPKSTWIEPKFLVGLLTNYRPPINNSSSKNS